MLCNSAMPPPIEGVFQGLQVQTSSKFEALVNGKSCENSNKCPGTWKNIPMMAIIARRPFANLAGKQGFFGFSSAGFGASSGAETTKMPLR